MSDDEPRRIFRHYENGNGNMANIWKVFSGIAVVASLIASIFASGMNYARNADNTEAIRDLQGKMQSEYMRQDTANLRFMALQEQLARIERLVSRP